MSDDFELGGEEVWLFQRHYVLRVHKAYIFFYLPIVLLDTTLIHRLVSFIALWSWTETVILTFNRFESIENNYMDTNPGMF